MSSINPNNIDGTYPIAGQDNDSQGFRDNFTNIKNNFTFAYDELTDLQSKAVLKSALTGGSLNNDMNYAQLISPQLLKSVETVNNLGTKTGTFTISWADGHFQYYTTIGNTVLAFSNWPTSNYHTKLRLQITTDTTNRTVTFPSAVSVGLSDIQSSAGQVVTLPTAGVYLFELTSYDNGTTITIQDLLRNYDITQSSSTFTTITVSTLANVTSTTKSTSSTTGALVVAGGAGIGGNVNIEGNLTVKGLVSSIVRTYSVKIDDDGSGTQEVFFFDNVAIKTNVGVYSNIAFFPGQTYRFDLSDSSNAPGPLRFSTTPDISVPGSITDYITGVTYSSNSAGNAGAYVDLTVRGDTPSPLYVYAYEANAAIDTSNIGAQYGIPIRGTVATADGTQITGNLAVTGNLNVSGNILVRGAVANTLTVNGTTTRAGATVDSGYQIYKPTANVSIQANVDVSRVIVAPTPSGSISSFWTDVILPNVSTNGHTITVSSNVRIETFRVLSPWVGYTVDTGANVILANNTPATFIFHSTENKWFKV
jgi:hypothetical protein